MLPILSPNNGSPLAMVKLAHVFWIPAVALMLPAHAENFAGRQFKYGEKVGPGTLLECDMVDAQALERLSPKSFDWALTSGLIEKPAGSGTAGFSDKVTTRNPTGQRSLLIGCWVTIDIHSGKNNGQNTYFAQGVYHLNDLVRNSPLAALPVCKTKHRNPVFVQGDTTIQYEKAPMACPSDDAHELVPSLTALEGQINYFEVRKGLGKSGYMRDVAW